MEAALFYICGRKTTIPLGSWQFTYPLYLILCPFAVHLLMLTYCSYFRMKTINRTNDTKDAVI